MAKDMRTNRTLTAAVAGISRLVTGLLGLDETRLFANEKRKMLANIMISDLQDKLRGLIQADPRFAAPADAVNQPWQCDVEIPDDIDEDDYCCYVRMPDGKILSVDFDIIDGEPMLSQDTPTPVERITSYVPVDANATNEQIPGKTPQDTENEIQDADKAASLQACQDAKEASATANDATAVAAQADTKEAHVTAAKAHQAAAKMNDAAAKGAGDNKWMQQTYAKAADGHREQADLHQSEADGSERSSKDLQTQAKAASASAMAASKYAEAAGTPEGHGPAANAHQAAMQAQMEAAKAIAPTDPVEAGFHEGQAKAHQKAAKFHMGQTGQKQDDSKSNEMTFWTCLRARLGNEKATKIAVDFIEPDNRIDLWIANAGGAEKAQKILANDNPQVIKLGDKDLGPQFQKISTTDNNSSQNAVAASNAAMEASAKLKALGKNAQASDYATAADAHLQAAAVHSGAGYDNPDMMDDHKALAQFHDANAKDATTMEQAAVDANPNRQTQLTQLHAMVGKTAIDLSGTPEAAAQESHRQSVADEMEKFMPTADALTSQERNAATAHIMKLRSGNGMPLQGVSSLVEGSQSNEGNAEGAAKGWETRRQGASDTAKAASETARTASAKADEAETEGAHREASTRHSDAAAAHTKAANLAQDDGSGAKFYHEQQAKAHTATAEFHAAKMRDAVAANSAAAANSPQSKADAADKAGNEASKKGAKANSAGSYKDQAKAHQAAADAHKDAAQKYHEAAKMNPKDSEYHEAMAKHHESIADAHMKWKADAEKADAPPAKANEAPPTPTAYESSMANEVVIAWDGGLVMEAANATDPTSNWIQISPYGDFPHTGGLQRFTKDDANSIIKDFNGPLSILKKTLGMGIPIYVGHPDHADFKAKYTDTKAYGRVKELQARDDGLWGNVKWSTAGKTMVNEEQFHGHSVNWRVRKDAEGNWRPFAIKSIGFTNEPNIPVMPITHANEFMDRELENDLQQAAA